MEPSRLHAYIRESLRKVVSNRRSNGVRFVLESGTAESFLRDLLTIVLHDEGYRLTRELPTDTGIVELAIHAEENVFIEVKQLHLMNGARYALNLVRDLERHKPARSLGVVYLLDERYSSSDLTYRRFRGANRKPRCDTGELMTGLREVFSYVYPTTTEEALVRRFTGAGTVDVYAYVVSLREEPT